MEVETDQDKRGGETMRRAEYRLLRSLLSAACLVVVVAAMKSAGDLLVPFLLALFITIIMAPAYFWLKNRGVADWAALTVLITGLVAATLVGGGLFGVSLLGLKKKLPEYQARFSGELEAGLRWLEGQGVEFSQEVVLNQLNPGMVFQFAQTVIGGATSLLGQSLLVLIVVIFMLLEAAVLPKKIHSLPGLEKGTMESLERSVVEVRNYMGIKTAMSLLTGCLVTVFLWVARVDFAILLGVLTFFMNYVPNFGFVLSFVPVVAIAYLDQGIGGMVVAGSGYIVLNFVIENLVQPRFLGKGLGLSTLVVLLSLLFWGWVLGPVGMLLSIPLTVAVKIGLETNPATRGVAILMGEAPARPKVVGEGEI